MDNDINNELPPMINRGSPSPNQYIEQAEPVNDIGQFNAMPTPEVSGNLSSTATPISGGQHLKPLTSVVPIGGAPASQATTSSSLTPQIADDSDLIEKEWVIKAKEIVSRTKQDPAQQTTEIQHVKADYIKKRFNKDIKLND